MQWQIYIQKFLARPSPTGPNSFVFTRFHQKVPVLEVGAPPTRVGAPNGKSWIRP